MRALECEKAVQNGGVYRSSRKVTPWKVALAAISPTTTPEVVGGNSMIALFLNLDSVLAN